MPTDFFRRMNWPYSLWPSKFWLRGGGSGASAGRRILPAGRRFDTWRERPLADVGAIGLQSDYDRYGKLMKVIGMI